MIMTDIFVPIAIEIAGYWNQQTIDVIEDIDRRISAITEQPISWDHRGSIIALPTTPSK